MIFVRNSIVNDPEVSKIDTNFLPGEYKDIRIHFDPLYDTSYDDYNIPSPMFIHSDIKMRLEKMFRGGRIIGKKQFATLPIEFESRFVSYGAWSPTDVNSNQKTSVYVETLSTFTHIFEKYLFNKTDKPPQDFIKASTILEFRTRDGEIFINTFQITDCYIGWRGDSLVFELTSGIENGIAEGLWTNVTMRIDEFPTLSTS